MTEDLQSWLYLIITVLVSVRIQYDAKHTQYADVSIVLLFQEVKLVLQ